MNHPQPNGDYRTSAQPQPVSANRLLAVLRNKNAATAIGPLRFVDSQQNTELQSVARAVEARRISTSNVLFTSGLGLPRTADIPLRLPAIMAPVLSILEKQHELGIPLSRYRVYQATAFIAETNEIDAEQAHVVSMRMAEYLSRYVATTHPSVADAVDIQFGCDYSNSVRSEVDTVRGSIGEVVDERALVLSEDRHSNSDGNVLNYAAANVVYSGATTRYPFEDAEHIIPVGGKPEEVFFKATRTYSQRNNRSVIPMLSGVGFCPTYYPNYQQRDAVTVDDPLPTFNPIRRDFDALEADGAPLSVLREIYPQPA